MKKTYQIGITVVIIIEEIHYLKSFFPKSFTVEEALYASIIELIKIIFACVPFLLVIGLGLFLIRYSNRTS